MAHENTIDPGMILAALEAKKAALEALISSWKAAVAVGALGPVSEIATLSTVKSGVDAPPTELPQGAFLGLSLPAAIKLYLSVARKKQTIKQIAEALKEGGVETTSDNFESVITGALNRMKKSKEILRFKDGWALAEHYSEQFRARLGNDVKKTSANTKKRKAKKGKQKGSDSKAQEMQPITAPKGEGKQEKLIQMLNSKVGAEYSAQELAFSIGAKIQVVHLLLGKLASKNRVEKTATGKYRAIKAA